MSSPLVSQPVSAGTDSHGAAWKAVLVRSVDHHRRLALVTDQFGKDMEIRCDILRAKGNLPEPGEQWIIDRHYGVWIFGAIINGTTRGVEVSNVTDLPETLLTIDVQADNDRAAAAAATQSLQNATVGQIAAKGDILGGTGAGALSALTVGGTNQVLSPDFTQPNWLAWKTPLALPQALPGATAAGRYVGQTTVGGAPTTGSFLVGDWIKDANGYIWQCTVAGSPGTWVCNINNRVTNVESSVSSHTTSIGSLQTAVSTSDLRKSGKHIWYANSVALNGSGADAVFTTWTQYFSDGIATYQGGGLFQLNQPGKWFIGFTAQSDATQPGMMYYYLLPGNPSAWGQASNTWLQSKAWRGSGWTNAGKLAQHISWCGRFASADAAQAFAIHGQWWCNTAAVVNTTMDYIMHIEYLGPV